MEADWSRNCSVIIFGLRISMNKKYLNDQSNGAGVKIPLYNLTAPDSNSDGVESENE